VLFRESERWDPVTWLRQMIRDRPLTPTLGQALFLGALILIVKFFAGLRGAAARVARDFTC